jgi:hypothetical protein
VYQVRTESKVPGFTKTEKKRGDFRLAGIVDRRSPRGRRVGEAGKYHETEEIFGDFKSQQPMYKYRL